MAKNVGKPLQSTLEWLVAHRESWLLDLNNLDDPSIPVNDYLPSCAHGDILITTRNRDLALLARGYHSGFRVSGMNPSDGTRLLLKTAKHHVHM